MEAAAGVLISTGLAPLNLQSQSMRVIREQVQWVLLHAAITLSALDASTAASCETH